MLLLNVFFALLSVYFLIKNSLQLKEKKETIIGKMYSVIKWFCLTKVIFSAPHIYQLIVILITKAHNDYLNVVNIILVSAYTSFCFGFYLFLPHVKISTKAFFKKLCGGLNELIQLQPLEEKIRDS